MKNPVENDKRAVLMSDIPLLVKNLRKSNFYVGLKRDEDGYYSDFPDWLARDNDDKDYCVFFPDYDTDSRPEGTKLYANANMVCTPSTNDSVGRDDYYGIGPFRYYDVNCDFFSDGTCKIRNIKGVDEDYSNTDDDAWIAAPVLYEKIVHSDEDHGTYVHLRDTPREGYQPQPGAYLPNGQLRNFMVYAKYPASIEPISGKWQSRSGKVLLRKVSHDVAVNYTVAQTDGTGAKTFADHWYPTMMMLIKYANRSSDAIGYHGFQSYSFQNYCTQAQTNQASVIVSTTTAGKFTVGRYVSVGVPDGTSIDRNYDSVHSLADTVKVLSIEPIENTTNSLITLDCDPFDSTTSTVISSMMPRNGLTDDLKGTDGYPIAGTRSPFRIQGIELLNGAYEIYGNVKAQHVAASSDDTAHYYIWIANDIDQYTTAGSAGEYTMIGEHPVSAEKAGWIYPKNFVESNGYIIPGLDIGGSSTTGLGDGINSVDNTKARWYEFPSLGSLFHHDNNGVFFADLSLALSSDNWNCGSRLSDLVRSMPPNVQNGE